MGEDECSEKALIDGIVKGKEWAFKKLFLRYYEPLCNFCWRYTKSKAISEDLVQEVWADLWKLRDTLDAKRSIRVYLYQAVKHNALDYLDHQKVVRRFEENARYENENFVTQRRSKQEDKAFIKEVREAIENLPNRAQQAYILHREDGLTYSEIAEVMEISIKTVESQISRALDLLRKQINSDFPDQVTENTKSKIFSIKSTGTE